MDSVVVIGGGFGGIAAADALGGDDVAVTIVDQRNFHTFLPLLYQVATASLNPADVAHPIRGILRGHRNVAVNHGTVTGADWAARLVHVRHIDGTVQSLPFDHLVVAAGASPTYFGVPGAAEHAFPLYSLDDATDLRNHLLARFEAADADPSIIDDGALTFVVVGGGPTGVEVAGALVELFQGVLRRDFATLEVSRARVILVELAPTVLPPFSPASQWHARDALRARGVELVLGDRVISVEPRRVVLAGGREIPTHTLVWAAGVQANPLAAALGVPTGPAGRITVDEHLRVPGLDGVYAVGDVAAIPAPSGSTLPQLAPVAVQSGRHAAAEIRAAVDGGRAPTPFRYRDRGTMATIGRRSAVAELPGGIRLSGSPAWVAWLVLHLVTLIGFRNRLSVLLNWSWNYLTWDRGPRLILGRVRGVGGYGHGTDSRGTHDPTVRDVPEG
ncbi:MAG: NAD(P)/FAD-dependent oxidoreductase [Acidimicrobiales bacterium]